jgi:putative phosphoribosyl transferase
MNLEISEEERNLLSELIESAEDAAIQSMDHADSRSFKEVLKARLDLLASIKEKICGQRVQKNVMKRSSESSTVSIPVGGYAIQGDLTLPNADAKSLVIFAHGSGSSRHSPRNKYVAEVLNRGGLATLLIDLLTKEEELVDMRTAEYRFDIPLLADRLLAATDWVARVPSLSDVVVAYFGASTGAAAALVAAAKRPQRVSAVVSRGGRPDLAEEWLEKVEAPALLIVGEFDRDVITLNRNAAKAMDAPTEIRIIRGATHLFEEEGALEQVASLAREWFKKYLTHRQVA